MSLKTKALSMRPQNNYGTPPDFFDVNLSYMFFHFPEIAGIFPRMHEWYGTCFQVTHLDHGE